ncbi:hypothetical protein DC094_07835 [Pelagibaculum spongiae]|uniref:Uncharacterized protein n=1 Tax=Pelagibaculum spongiae TaxID=2080658 RepID=A0A2V1GZW8_9GAMM|nr:hypothetical protein DC094_07835 [Pelagibaculum spongiae]
MVKLQVAPTAAPCNLRGQTITFLHSFGAFDKRSTNNMSGKQSSSFLHFLTKKLKKILKLLPPWPLTGMNHL